MWQQKRIQIISAPFHKRTEPQWAGKQPFQLAAGSPSVWTEAAKAAISYNYFQKGSLPNHTNPRTLSPAVTNSCCDNTLLKCTRESQGPSWMFCNEGNSHTYVSVFQFSTKTTKDSPMCFFLLLIDMFCVTGRRVRGREVGEVGPQGASGVDRL